MPFLSTSQIKQERKQKQVMRYYLGEIQNNVNRQSAAKLRKKDDLIESSYKDFSNIEKILSFLEGSKTIDVEPSGSKEELK